uniref:Ig-like domain-containing protein n=1 Tax=Buteo japonicus TaxID=224669 RepID=A0A8C0BJM6_9AVES
MGPGASSRLTAGQPGTGDTLSVWQHLSPCAGAPTISIFLKPPGVIPPGGSTTICCSCQGDNGNFVLYKKGHQLRSLELLGSRAEFSISNATHEDTGPYSCHYVVGSWISWWLPPPHQSPTHLLMPSTLPTEFRLPKPVLSVLPGHEVVAGSYVTFRCTIAHASAGCFLYLEGQVKTLSLLPKEQDDFNLSHVHKGNGGRYSCQCFTKGASLEWSAVSKTLDLVVRGETSPQPHPALLFLPGWRGLLPGSPSDCPFLCPADYTWSNVVRLALGAGVLVLLGLIMAEAVHSHQRRPRPC